jgi:hypothetical protein
MLNRCVLIISTGVCLGALTASAYSGEITNAWQWEHSNPLSQVPQALVIEDGEVGDNEDIREWIRIPDGFWWVGCSYQGEDNDYHYILFWWDYKPDWEEIYFRWRIAVDSGADVHVYRWTGSAWDHIANNDGGLAPPAASVEVTDYFDAGGNLVLLAVGATLQAGYRCSYCDVAKLKATP